MNFWESDFGEISGSAADAFAKTFTRIPDGTMATAKIQSFVNSSHKGESFLAIEWLLTGGDFKGQVATQKLKVFGDKFAKDSEKARFRALNMLKLIYTLSGITPKHSGSPTDQDLYLFVGKEAGIKIRETEPNDEGKQYNYVSEVHDKKGFQCETGVSIVVTHKNVQGSSRVESAFSRNENVGQSAPVDEIPF